MGDDDDGGPFCLLDESARPGDCSPDWVCCPLTYSNPCSKKKSSRSSSVVGAMLTARDTSGLKVAVCSETSFMCSL